MLLPRMRNNLLQFVGFLLIFLPSSLSAQEDTMQHIVSGRANSPAQQQKPYVILISADGFRYDLADKYHAVNLLRLREQGVAATSMIPSYPSLTFPNHYSIITGLYPAHHGLVDNGFYDEKRGARYGMSRKDAVADSSWYGGTPLWVLSEQQHLLSASFYWVASESAIQGVRPTYYYVYNEKIDMPSRVRAVKDWLQLPEEKRPHFITFYFPQVDHAEHTYGPDSKEAEQAVHLVDDGVGALVSAVQSTGLPVNFIFVADHGMTAVDTLHTMPLPAAVDTSKFIVPWGDALVHLYAKNKADVMPTYTALKKSADGYDVYLADEIPTRWNYSRQDDRYGRIGDILLVPRLPRVFSLSGKSVTPGKHGFDNALFDMHASFYAWGPAFKNHLHIPSFENIHIYPLVARLLGLDYPETTIDGRPGVLAPILK
jgi:predicted AlkP superfamily pyrophosphatase or phosphodiesterase